MLKYLLFLMIGIIIYILFKSTNGFSVGGPVGDIYKANFPKINCTELDTGENPYDNHNKCKNIDNKGDCNKCIVFGRKFRQYYEKRCQDELQGQGCKTFVKEDITKEELFNRVEEYKLAAINEWGESPHNMCAS